LHYDGKSYVLPNGFKACNPPAIHNSYQGRTMLNPTRLLLALGLLAITTQAHAACTTKSFDGKSMSRCNVWPAFPSQAISVKSTYLADSGGDDAGAFDLELALLNASNAKPIATYHKPGAYNSDAVRLEDVRIDTARYRLTPDVRAFGLRAKFAHSSHAIPYEKTDLALYVREGDELRPVLKAWWSTRTTVSSPMIARAITEKSAAPSRSLLRATMVLPI
jgi:hypothetical protein